MSEEIEFRSEEFQEMMINLYDAPKNKNLLEVFPELAQFEEFQATIKGVSPNKLVKYIGFAYDRRSPVVKKVESLIKRKIIAAKIAGFIADEKGHFDKTVVDIMKGIKRDANKMIIRYCRMQSPRTYSLIAAGNETYFDLIEQIHTRDTNDKGEIIDDAETKSKLFDRADSMQKKIDRHVDEMILMDRHTELEDELFLSIDKQEEPINLSPERIVEDLT